MPMRDLLRLLATETGERLWAIDESRLSLAERAPVQASAGIAVVSLQGVLTPRAVSYYGRVVSPGMDTFRHQLSAAAANADVGAIVLDVNSPGGTYAGTPETADLVSRVAAIKPVTAMVDTLCASAAYFIAAQANEVVITPSGEAGSIGVVAVHMEASKALEDFGIKVNVIRSRASKADVNPFEPLTDEARSALEASVQEADGEFLKAVAKGRNMTVAQARKLVDDNGLGRVVGGKQAVALGLADRVGTVGEVLSGMIKPRAGSSAGRRRSSLFFA